jgi:hypothetical protein
MTALLFITYIYCIGTNYDHRLGLVIYLKSRRIEGLSLKVLLRKPQQASTAPSRIFAFPLLIQCLFAMMESSLYGSFLCMLWSRNYFEGRGVPCVWDTSARNVAAA